MMGMPIAGWVIIRAEINENGREDREYLQEDGGWAWSQKTARVFKDWDDTEQDRWRMIDAGIKELLYVSALVPASYGKPGDPSAARPSSQNLARGLES